MLEKVLAVYCRTVPSRGVCSHTEGEAWGMHTRLSRCVCARACTIFKITLRPATGPWSVPPETLPKPDPCLSALPLAVSSAYLPSSPPAICQHLQLNHYLTNTVTDAIQKSRPLRCTTTSCLGNRHLPRQWHPACCDPLWAKPLPIIPFFQVPPCLRFSLSLL